MLRQLLLAKLHRACVTDCHLDYEGSIAIDEDLIDRAGMLVHEKVQVVNITNGARFETYLIPAARGSRGMIINGAAARLCQARDRIIVLAYALLDQHEWPILEPTIVHLDEENRVLA